ncbi:MAG: uroporphyrinogen-III synthase [Pseudomonadota bacterium]
MGHRLPPVAQVVLTRPAGANDALRAALEAARPAGLEVDRHDLPLLAIRPASDSAPLRDALGAMRPSDLVVFVSPRAVEMAAACRPLAEWPEARLAVVGRATGEALARAGRPAEFLPEGTEDSEGLLRRLANVEVDGDRVWIIRGETGRTLLAERLAERGARPVFVPVYRRECAGRPDDPLVTGSGPATAWILTAPQAIDCLAALAPSTGVQASGLLDSSLVVINERARERACALGFRGEIVVAGGPSPELLARAFWEMAERRTGAAGE